MSARHAEVARHVILAASAAGGPAPHFRVQIHEPTDDCWHLYAAYRNRRHAEQSVQQLVDAGHAARLVDYSCCPAAA